MLVDVDLYARLTTIEVQQYASAVLRIKRISKDHQNDEAFLDSLPSLLDRLADNTDQSA